MSNILLVDDSEEEIKGIKLSLRLGRHQVLVAKNVDEAKALLYGNTFDLIICGVRLNRGTIFDLLSFLNNEPDRRQLPFVCFSCSPTDLGKSVDESLRKTAMLLGATSYITHASFDPSKFRSEIESLLLENASGKAHFEKNPLRQPQINNATPSVTGETNAKRQTES